MTQVINYQTYKPLLDCLVDLIQKALDDQVISMILYGSVAREDAREKSDVDLLLVLEEAPPVWQDASFVVEAIKRILGPAEEKGDEESPAEGDGTTEAEGDSVP